MGAYQQGRDSAVGGPAGKLAAARAAKFEPVSGVGCAAISPAARWGAAAAAWHAQQKKRPARGSKSRQATDWRRLAAEPSPNQSIALVSLAALASKVAQPPVFSIPRRGFASTYPE